MAKSTTAQCYSTNMLKYYIIMALNYNSVTVLKCDNTIVLQYYSGIVLLCPNIIVLQYLSVTLVDHSVTLIQFYNFKVLH